MSDLDFDLEQIQRVVDLGPYRLQRCAACRGVNLGGAQTQCGWCGQSLVPGGPATPPAPPKHPQRARRGPSGSRPRPQAR